MRLSCVTTSAWRSPRRAGRDALGPVPHARLLSADRRGREPGNTLADIIAEMRLATSPNARAARSTTMAQVRWSRRSRKAISDERCTRLRYDHQAGQAAATSVQPSRGLLRFITCGSVDDGKSTLIGRLLYDSTLVGRPAEALDRDSRKSARKATSSIWRCWSTAFGRARTGHHYRCRLPLLRDSAPILHRGRHARPRAIHAQHGDGRIRRRSRHHPYRRAHGRARADAPARSIVSLVGIRHVVLAVNKMDLVGYDQARFLDIERDYRALAEDLGFEQITVIPISARDGDNVSTASATMPWYRGPSLIEHLETVDATPALSAAGFLLPVQWVNRPISISGALQERSRAARSRRTMK